MKLYALSDPHGCLDVLAQALSVVKPDESHRVIFLGDYVPHQTLDMNDTVYLAQCDKSLRFIRDYQRAHAPHVVTLMGNHEYDLLWRFDTGSISLDPRLMHWVEQLPLCYETDDIVFVHAALDETRPAEWQLVTADETFLAGTFEPNPSFPKTIVFGHRNMTHGNPGVYCDNMNHIGIDAATETTGFINLLSYDTDTHAFENHIVTASTISDAKPISLPE